MEEEKKPQTPEAPKKSCHCASDLRTFLISLLTALIVVSIYHLGTGYCRMKAALNRRAAAPQVQRGCPTMPPPPCNCASPECRKAMPPRFDRGPKPNFEGRPGRRHFRPGDRPMMKRGPRPADAPKAPEAPKTPEAPKAPAK